MGKQILMGISIFLKKLVGNDISKSNNISKECYNISGKCFYFFLFRTTSKYGKCHNRIILLLYRNSIFVPSYLQESQILG